MKIKFWKIAVAFLIGIFLMRVSGLDLRVLGQSLGQKKPIALSKNMKAVYSQKEAIKMEVENESGSQLKTKLVDINNTEVPVEIIENDNNGVSELKINPSPQFKSGRYKLTVVDSSGNEVEQNFLWGVLAINPNKSIYYPGEVANLAMAVLDESGKMICDAKLTLTVTNSEQNIKEELSTENGKITVNQECQFHDFTLNPDYEAKFKLEKLGNYNLELKAETSNGTYTITDQIEAKEIIDFEVERISATRIYPVNTYPVTLNIVANQDFSGNIYEEVPLSFEISQVDGNKKNYIAVNDENKNKKIVWQVDLKKGDKISLGYQYKAPEISPQFYLAGPLSMTTLTDLIYTEPRQWQIAADAISPTSIRQEINIIDGPVTTGGTDAAMINLDTSKYNGATYYFEIIANKGAGTTLTVNLSTGNTDTVGIGISDTTNVLVRKQFTPETGSFDYRLNLTTGTTPTVKVARIIILQSASYITDTQTQIEIGNKEVGITVTTGVKLPVMQGIGVTVAGTASVTPVWPTHQSGDIALLFVESTGGTVVELSTPAGFALVPNSPQATGVGVSGTALTVFWCRATSSSMTNPVVKDAGDHVFAVILTYRNVIETGDPWNVTVGTTKSIASTTTYWGDFTTTVDKTLLVFAASRDNDSAAAAWSLIRNPNLAAFFERVDSGTTSGNGGGLKIGEAIMQLAGVGGTSSATVTSSINATMVIALKGGDVEVETPLSSPKYWNYNSANWDTGTTFYAEATWKKDDVGTYTPRFQGIGTSVNGTGAVTPVWPTHQEGDVALLFVESTGDTVVTLTTPAGFTQVANSPKATGVGSSGTALTVFWCRATSSSMTNPVVKDSGDHNYAVMVTYRNVIETGNPWDVTVGTTKPANSTTTYWGDFTTTVKNTLVVFAASRGNDSAAAAWGLISMNANFIGSNERHDGGTTSGNGGGLKISDAVWKNIGTGGTSSATVTNSMNATMLIALKGRVDTDTLVYLKVQEDDGAFGTWSDKVTILDPGRDSGVVTRSRSLSFTPTSGRNYRLVKTLNNANEHSLDIYNAKIVADQSNSLAISKLEPQYLLLNTASTTIGSTLGYQTLWNSSEWARTTNVYKHAVDSIGVGTSTQLVDINNANTLVTNSKVMGAGQTISANLTMPSSGHYLDTWLLGSGEVDASRILAQVTINMPPAEYTQASFRWANDIGGENHGGVWRELENADTVGVSKNTNIRLRFSVSNIGDTGLPTFRLQIAPLGVAANCGAVATGNYIDVPTTAGVGTSLAIMAASANYADQASTTNQLTASSTTFVAGKMVELPSNTANSITLIQNSYTEVEYNFQFAEGADYLTTYCLRVANAGTALSNYTYVAGATIRPRGPNLDQLMRHGDWFINGVRQSFTF